MEAGPHFWVTAGPVHSGLLSPDGPSDAHVPALLCQSARARGPNCSSVGRRGGRTCTGAPRTGGRAPGIAFAYVSASRLLLLV